MTTYLGKSCSFCLPRVPFVNCRQFMYLVISLLVLRAGYGIWLYQFLIIAYLFTFHMEPPCAVRNKKMFKCSRSHGHAHIWWKTSQIFFFGTKRLMTLKLSIQHRVLEYYQCFHMMAMGWPWPFLWQCQICFRMLLHGRKLIQHWVLLYFKVCSNSAYPQHSGERYRTSGPLVWYFFLWWPRFVLKVDI